MRRTQIQLDEALAPDFQRWLSWTRPPYMVRLIPEMRTARSPGISSEVPPKLVRLPLVHNYGLVEALALLQNRLNLGSAIQFLQDTGSFQICQVDARDQ